MRFQIAHKHEPAYKYENVLLVLCGIMYLNLAKESLLYHLNLFLEKIARLTLIQCVFVVFSKF